MTRHRLIAACVVALALPSTGVASTRLPTCVIEARDPIVFFDKLGAAFERLDSAMTAELAAGAATLTAVKLEEMRLLATQARNAFAQIEKKRSGGGLEPILWTTLGDYKDYVDLAYDPNPPPAPIQQLICPLLDSYISVTQQQLADHERRFKVRYGESSERLNIAEILLTEIFQEPRAMGPLRSPGRWEPILRVQALGIHYDLAAEQLRPTSPIYQAGTAFYLYEDNKFSRAINHIGLAYAYQVDLTTKAKLRGGILHVSTFDLGLLCPDTGCDDGVLVASKNLSALPEVWTYLRKKLH